MYIKCTPIKDKYTMPKHNKIINDSVLEKYASKRKIFIVTVIKKAIIAHMRAGKIMSKLNLIPLNLFIKNSVKSSDTKYEIDVPIGALRTPTLSIPINITPKISLIIAPVDNDINVRSTRSTLSSKVLSGINNPIIKTDGDKHIKKLKPNTALLSSKIKLNTCKGKNMNKKNAGTLIIEEIYIDRSTVSPASANLFSAYNLDRCGIDDNDIGAIKVETILSIGMDKVV